jgi:LysM repeat protein
MSDQIEARLSRYFAQLRPNAAEPAEARLVAALDRAAAERLLGWRPDEAGLARRQEVHRRQNGRAIAGLGALAVIAIVASLAVRGMSSVGGPGASESPEASGAAASVSPSMFATDSSSPGASESPEASGAAASVSPSMFATDSSSPTSPMPSASAAPAESYFQFTVRPGDQWWAIARYFNITECELRMVNPQIKDPTHLEAGWVLNIPMPGQVKCVAASPT